MSDTNTQLTPAEYFNNVKQKDHELFTKWKSTGDKKALSQLMHQISPIVYSEVQRASGSLPNSALSAEAKKWALKAIQTYDPAKGTALSTHVANYLPKVRRMNYKYQNAVRLPENMQLKYHDYNQALTSLTEEYNREPTEEELAKKLGWTKPQTVKFKNSLYADLIESSSERPGEYTQFDYGKVLMEHIRSQLSPEEMTILENSKVLSATELAAKLGVNINRLNYLKGKVIDKIKKIQLESGLM